MKTRIELSAEERKRQIEKEGWSKEHDESHYVGERAKAAICYAMTEEQRKQLWRLSTTADEVPSVPPLWPFVASWWKPTPQDRRRELVKAGALIAAEIDRLQMETEKEK